MGRRLARELAFFALFQYDLGRVPWPDASGGYWPNMNFLRCRSFLQEIVADAIAKREEIDGLCGIIRRRAGQNGQYRPEHPPFSGYELLYCSDIPVEVTVNEAVEMAKNSGMRILGSL